MEVDAGADFDLALLTAATAGRGPVGRRRSPGGPITLRRERDDVGRRRPGRARGEHEEAVPEAGRREAERLGPGGAYTSWIISLFVLHPSLPGSPAAHPRREEKGIGGWVCRGQIASSLHGRRIRGAGSGRWLTSPTMDVLWRLERLWTDREQHQAAQSNCWHLRRNGPRRGGATWAVGAKASYREGHRFFKKEEGTRACGPGQPIPVTAKTTYKKEPKQEQTHLTVC
jgi:hypothetical protein